jgi:hypothetical protein
MGHQAKSSNLWSYFFIIQLGDELLEEGAHEGKIMEVLYLLIN